MNAEELAQSAMHDAQAPTGLSAELEVLWLSKAGRWHEAHDIAQDLPGRDGAWLHAYLHREEGDQWNASYWYQRAKQPTPPPTLSLTSEWTQLASHFCSSEK